MDKAKAFQALSHPVRLKIMEILSQKGEVNVGELHTLCGVDFGQSALSQHLAVLRGAELVETRKESQRSYYSIDQGNVRLLVTTLEGMAAS